MSDNLRDQQRTTGSKSPRASIPEFREDGEVSEDGEDSEDEPDSLTFSSCEFDSDEEEEEEGGSTSGVLAGVQKSGANPANPRPKILEKYPSKPRSEIPDSIPAQETKHSPGRFALKGRPGLSLKRSENKNGSDPEKDGSSAPESKPCKQSPQGPKTESQRISTAMTITDRNQRKKTLENLVFNLEKREISEEGVNRRSTTPWKTDAGVFTADAESGGAESIESIGIEAGIVTIFTESLDSNCTESAGSTSSKSAKSAETTVAESVETESESTCPEYAESLSGVSNVPLASANVDIIEYVTAEIGKSVESAIAKTTNQDIVAKSTRVPKKPNGPVLKRSLLSELFGEEENSDEPIAGQPENTNRRNVDQWNLGTRVQGFSTDTISFDSSEQLITSRIQPAVSSAQGKDGELSEDSEDDADSLTFYSCEFDSDDEEEVGGTSGVLAGAQNSGALAGIDRPEQKTRTPAQATFR